jgi:hypothetical protein
MATYGSEGAVLNGLLSRLSYANVAATAAILLVGLPALAAVASVVPPVRGAVYEEHVANSNVQGIQFRVSANRKSLSHFFASPISIAVGCGVGGGGASNYSFPSKAKISAGRFSVTHVDRVLRATVSGQFVAHGGVRGKVTLRQQCFNAGTGKPSGFKHATRSWSGTSEPQGKASRYCFDRNRLGRQNRFVSIIRNAHTTCTSVYTAMNTGTFGAVAPFAFSTPGWTCTNPSGAKFNGGRQACSKHNATFSFFRG